MLEPLAGFGDIALFFFGDGFVVDGRVSQGAGNRIEHGFERSPYGGELCGGKLVEIGMRLFLLWVGFHASHLHYPPFDGAFHHGVDFEQPSPGPRSSRRAARFPVLHSRAAPESGVGLAEVIARRFRLTILEMPIGIFAISDSDHFDGVVAVFALDKSPIADTEAKEARIEAFELFDVAGLCLEKTVKRLQQAQRGVAVDGTEIGAPLGRP